ncbi:prolyl oligopeptidase family serine peptidase [Streptomyces sp. TRM 70361]|uniref:S9 family peptidase n=1 Tax=Streptomyces sp. TRM 70361 TaxID=3116553 RepID=UPI002E7BD298|nr:prolyl oligopeptidase family serine peptidase [Streptomyces sp. TRM 70361]MEE1939223.1 prolyl oligopeptidase family serine peptidase [Streptomyces sp. TRM 70361]
MVMSFPRQYARTQRFTLGAPRAFTVAPDGSRAVFLRSAGGTDRANRLWVLDLTPDGGPEAAGERLVADPAELLGGADEELSPEERARRERSREGSAGVVGYATDAAVETAAFALSGRLFTADLRTGAVRELPVPTPVVDPRPSPDGRRIAYVVDGALRVTGPDGPDGLRDGGADRVLAEPEETGAGRRTTWGLAEFVAAEEMDRLRGFWWSPDGTRLLAARVDDSAVRRWWITDPANPGSEPAEVAYPAAGTPNAEVTLHLLDLGDTANAGSTADAGASGRTEVVWDRARYPYLARVHWSAAGPPLLLVQSRDQRDQLYLTVDTATGRTAPLHADEDPAWLELFPGVPAWTPDGRLVRIADEGGARVLLVGDRPLTSAALHVRAVLDIGEEDVLFSASAGPDAPGDVPVGEIAVYRAWFRGSGDQGGWERVSGVSGVPEDAGHLASAVRGGETVVLSTAVPDRPGALVEALRLPESGKGAPTPLAVLASHTEKPVLTARPRLLRAGARGIPTAVLLPAGHRDGDGPLPVLMDPYGGPHGQRVVAAHNAYLTSQWFADQGFAVVVADGRGTPGHSPGWEKAVAGDLAGVTLEDQVEALHALAGSHPLDLDRVGIRGWSYGGYLAALAVLRRPDVFHAAVAGAPVTDWRLYDTHYTERYLGLPDERPAVYAANSLVTDEGLSAPAETHRPLMIVHGLADDNVVAAHTLRLSSALLAAGRPHEVLPLSGVTHMTPQEQVAENLLLLQVAFLKRSLGVV